MKFLTKALFLAFAVLSSNTVDAQRNNSMGRDRKGPMRGDNHTMSDR